MFKFIKSSLFIISLCKILGILTANGDDIPWTDEDNTTFGQFLYDIANGMPPSLCDSDDKCKVFSPKIWLIAQSKYPHSVEYAISFREAVCSDNPRPPSQDHPKECICSVHIKLKDGKKIRFQEKIHYRKFGQTIRVAGQFRETPATQP